MVGEIVQRGHRTTSRRQNATLFCLTPYRRVEMGQNSLISKKKILSYFCGMIWDKIKKDKKKAVAPKFGDGGATAGVLKHGNYSTR